MHLQRVVIAAPATVRRRRSGLPNRRRIASRGMDGNRSLVAPRLRFRRPCTGTPSSSTRRPLTVAHGSSVTVIVAGRFFVVANIRTLPILSLGLHRSARLRDSFGARPVRSNVDSRDPPCVVTAHLSFGHAAHVHGFALPVDKMDLHRPAGIEHEIADDRLGPLRRIDLLESVGFFCAGPERANG